MLAKIKNLFTNEFYRNVFTLISATSVAQAIAFLIYPVLTRIYEKEEHGIFSIYMSIVAITAIISTGKYDLAVLMPKSDKKSIHITVLSVLLSLFFSILLLLLVILFGRRFSIILGNENIWPWLYLVPVSTFLVSVFQTLSCWSNRNKRYRRIAGANVSQSVANSGIKITASEVLPNAGGLIAGSVVGQFVGAMIYITDIYRKDRKLLTLISGKEIIRCISEFRLFPKFSMPHYLVNNLSSSLPVFAISAWYSTIETGLYSLAFLMVFRPVNLITNSLTQVISQQTVSRFNEGKDIRAVVRSFLRKILYLGLFPFLFSVILSLPWVFGFVFGREWTEAGRYMQILMPWIFISYLSSPLSFLPDMLGMQKKAMWIDIVKLFTRILSIAIGIYLSDIYILLICFSFTSTLVTLYTFFWYLRLSVLADKQTHLAGSVKPEIFFMNEQDIQGI